jgi:hypothetical protein
VAYLTIASNDISVAAASPERDREEIGRRERSFDGTMRSSVRARKNSWRVMTTWYTRANADTLLAALEGSPPLAASGDLLGGSVNVHVSAIKTTHRPFADGERVALSFVVAEV